MSKAVAKGLIDRDFHSALAALQAGKLGDAVRLFEAVLRVEPKHLGALNLMGVVLTKLGRFTDAETYLRRALQHHPPSDATLYNYGIVLKALNRLAEALQRLSEAISLNPSVAESWNNRGTIFNDLKRYEEAITDFDKATALNPRYADAFHNKGKSLIALKRGDEALTAFGRALAINPGFAAAWLGRGYVFCLLKRHDEADDAYNKALSIKPDLEDAWLGRGNVFTDLKRYDDALSAYDKALSIKPDLAEVWLGRGNVFWRLQRFDDALSAYDKALSIKSDLENGWLGRGNVFASLKRYGDALSAYDKALSIKSDLDDAWLSRGNVFADLKRYDDAFAAYDKALSIKPNLENAWLGRGYVFAGLKRYEEALAAYDKALSLRPDLENAWLGLGYVFADLKRYEEALAAYDKALSLKPDLENAWFGRGKVLFDLKHYDESFAAYDKAFSLEPDLYDTEGIRLHVKMNCCNWTNLDPESEHLLRSIRSGKQNSVPFVLLTIDALPEDQLRCADIWVRKNYPVESYQNLSIGPREVDKIRIAYLSADFHRHATAYLVAELFELQDRSRFEVLGISFGPNDRSETRSRLVKSFDQFHDVRLKSDRDVARLVNELHVDIAVDLKGHTKESRPGILAYRPAPIQVNYLGYPGTMGADFIDYVIADEIVLPFDQQPYYTEKIVHLPGCYQVNDSKRKIATDKPTRHDAGLPERGFVFCSFNNNYKITSSVFEVWMRLLQAVDGSVLWLLRDNDSAEKNLRREAAARGIDPARLVFAARAPLEDHLARHCLADLFLDTLPCNAHTTASDALWAGLPVLTQIGQTFAGRVAASLLHAIGLSELITHSREEYETLAIELALNRGKLLSIKEKLGRNRLSTLLFDTTLFTKHLEAAYEAIYRRYRAGLPPDQIEILPIGTF